MATYIKAMLEAHSDNGNWMCLGEIDLANYRSLVSFLYNLNGGVPRFDKKLITQRESARHWCSIPFTSYGGDDGKEYHFSWATFGELRAYNEHPVEMWNGLEYKAVNLVDVLNTIVAAHGYTGCNCRLVYFLST